MNRLLLLTLLASLTMPALADVTFPPKKLTIVADEGGVSTEPYFRELGLLGEADNKPAINSKPMSRPIKDTDMLPVRSESLKPGKVAFREIKAFGITPFFLIGDDPLSRRWLAENRAKLFQLRASGMIVNIENPEALTELKKIAPELLLLPISGDDIAQRLGLSNYPVLITATYLEQ